MPARKLDELLETKATFQDNGELSPEYVAELKQRLKEINNGTAVLYSLEELEAHLEATIAKYK